MNSNNQFGVSPVAGFPVGNPYYNNAVSAARMGQPYTPMPASYSPIPGTYPQQQTGQDIQWVSGISGANAFNVPKGSGPVMLMDNDEKRFYIKTVDPVTGRQLPLEIYEYHRVEDPQNGMSFDPGRYVTKEEFKQIEQKLDSMLASLQQYNNGMKGGQ